MTKVYTNDEIRANRTAWIKALKSGEYKKGKSVLRDNDDNYCCLGVACEVIGIEGNIHYDKWHYNQTTLVAPEEVVKALGLYNSEGRICNLDDAKESPYYRLTGFNDNSDTFEPVIKAIESGNYWRQLDD